jgi:hypothetical protein
MNTYTVHIESIEHYTISVTASDKDIAEELAWRLFPHYAPDFVENNVTEVICESEEPK